MSWKSSKNKEKITVSKTEHTYSKEIKKYSVQSSICYTRSTGTSSTNTSRLNVSGFLPHSNSSSSVSTILGNLPLSTDAISNTNYQSFSRNFPEYKGLQNPRSTLTSNYTTTYPKLTPSPIVSTPTTTISRFYPKPTASLTLSNPTSTTTGTGRPYPKPVLSPLVSISTNNEPNKKIVVKKTGQFYDGSSTIPTYSTRSKNRGEVLIINNIMFKDNKAYRHGAKVDDAKLEDLFKQMGFKVQSVRNLKKLEMKSKVQNFSKKWSLRNADISVVVVMSHGTTNKHLGGTEVFSIDEQGVSVDELIYFFNEKDCESMRNKPKIFIFQCCRGDNEQFSRIQSDSVPVKPTEKIVTNALIAYSTLPGFVSHRDPERGTWYISTLCDVFSQHAHEHHVEDLLKIVDQKLGSFDKNIKQSTQYENRGFKRCYLHPV